MSNTATSILPRALRSERGSRAVTSLLDQVFSSVSNILIIFTVARVSSVSQFGLVVLMLACVTTSLTILRGVIGTPLILVSGRDEIGIRYEAQRSLSVSLLCAVTITSGAILAIGVATDHLASAAAVAAAAVFVMTEDVYRYATMAFGQPAKALLWDAIWTLISTLVFAASWLDNSFMTAELVILLWGGSALLCCVGFGVTYRLWPQLSGLRKWLVRDIGARVRFGLEASVGAGSVLIVATIAAALVGPEATAALRGAGTVVGPLTIVITALAIVVIPDSARRNQSLSQVWRTLRYVALPMSALAIAIGFLGYFLPSWIGEILLGNSWAAVVPLLPYTGLEFAAISWLSCIALAFSATAMSHEFLRAGLVHAISSIILCTTAALIFGSARSIAGALVVSACFALLINGLNLRGRIQMAGPKESSP